MKKIIILALMAISLVPCIEINAQETQSTRITNQTTIDIRKDKLEWRYKIMNGRVYKRLFNASKNRWETDWILVQ
ncbi:hypothetical protein WKT02_14540 [Erysipelotrichaceae bacterium HCN-30851]